MTTPAAPQSVAEITVRAVILGIVLSVVMGAANVYLGLKAGMTVSASIPAAVIATGILRGIFRNGTVLEANLVQTSASAGESLAAGIIFTVPALVLLGLWETFDFWTTTWIAFAGGLLGILFMIPMRRVFVVEHPDLRFPEGIACAEVLTVAEQDAEAASGGASSGIRNVGSGILVGAVMKFLEKFLGLIQDPASWATLQGRHVYYFGLHISPALLAVGYIVGLSVAVQIFAGGAIGWLIAIPLLDASNVTGDSAADIAGKLWSTKVRYMGVGAMVVGGMVSIWKVRQGLAIAGREVFSLMTNKSDHTVPDTERNLGGGQILALTLLCVGAIAWLYFTLLHHVIGVTILTTTIMIVMAFFFTAVASYIVGLVGNSNSPVSGMTITAFLGTAALLLLFGYGGTDGMLAALGVAGVVCCVACTAGDVCNDLKTGHLVGASPRRQQIMQIVGVTVASVIMAPVMKVLHEGSDGLGSTDFPAPQAQLFRSLAEAFFGEGDIPWTMVGWGVGVAGLLLLVDLVLAKQNSTFRIHVMPVAVGIYLPFDIAVPILFGGLIAWTVKRRKAGMPEDAAAGQQGVLVASGLIAGESLIGVLLAFLAYLGYKNYHFGENLLTSLGIPEGQISFTMAIISTLVLLALGAWLFRRATRQNQQ